MSVRSVVVNYDTVINFESEKIHQIFSQNSNYFSKSNLKFDTCGFQKNKTASLHLKPGK
jgi:ABC-type transport system involved in Fe-S cluster assembly fused permease/ATPase subunit